MMSPMTEYPNPYLTTDYSDYQDPYSSGSSYDNYYNETDTAMSSKSYPTDSYRAASTDNYSEKYNSDRYNDSQRYDDTQKYDSSSQRYDEDRPYAGLYDNTQEERDRYSDSQEDRERQSRRNRSERRRHMRRDSREDAPREDRRDDRRDDRGRDRDRDDRGRDREERGRGRDREDVYTRDRESLRSRDHSRDSDRSSHSDRDRERDRDRSRTEDERAGEKWVTSSPTNTILLRGLPIFIEEKDIRAELMLFGAPIKDVRLMRKSSGASRGFAFVEFQSIDDSLRWMDTNQRKLLLQNQYSCTMYFSTPKDRHDKLIVHKMDWNCAKCGAHNFKRRDHCFGCNLSRHESGKAQADGFDHVGTNPCNTILFRGLDALTTEETIMRSLTNFIEHTCKNVKVIRHPATQISAGYAFVEFSSVAESMNILELLKNVKPGFEVDGKQILVSFAKNTFNTSIATIAAAAAAAANNQQQTWDQSASSEYYQGYDYSQYNQSGYYSGQYYDGQTYDYSGYYATTTTTATTTMSAPTVATTTSVNTSATSTDATNAAAAVAQAAIQQAQAAKHYQKQVQKQKKIAEMTKEEQLAHQAQEWTQKAQEQTKSSTETKKYPPPDVSLYQFDETSGYYYDPVSTLYYDASSQYYYNGTTGQFMYWDAEQSTYLPAPTNTEDGSNTNSLLPKEEKKETKDKKEKVKVAKKIAKDMEKWAKSMNAQKEAVKDGIRKINLPNMGKKESATADAGFAILEKAKTVPGEDKKLMPPPPPMGGSESEKLKAGLVASYGGDSDDDDDEGSPGDKVFDETKLLDFDKMACLLCKRQFQSKDQLNRHAQMSDLHKTNIETLRQSQSSGGGASGLQYRDRAKERREKIGSTAPPARKRPSIPEVYEQPTKAGIGEDNIGSKMLQKMGWSSGQGLGKEKQGIVKPIQAERRSATAGLGMRGANYNIEDTDNYKEALRKTMFARYQEFE